MQLAVTLLWSAAVGTSGAGAQGAADLTAFRRRGSRGWCAGAECVLACARLRVCVCETLVSHGHESGPQISGCKATTAWGWTVAPKRYVHI